MNVLERTVRSLKGGLRLSSNSRFVAKLRPAYDSLLHLCYGRRGLVRVLNGQESIRIRPPHRYAAEHYEPAVFDYLKKKIRPGDRVLDVGAHVGIFAVLLARWSGPNGHVVAFEPTPVTRAALTDHLHLNGVDDRVTVCPLAVSDNAGKSFVYTVSNSPENTLSPVHSRLTNASAIAVETTTIDAFCVRRQICPDLIKIDIEGFELHALRGAKRTLTKHRPVVVVELHPMNWPEIGVDRHQVAELLKELRYQLTPLDGQKDPLAEYGHVVLQPDTGD